MSKGRVEAFSDGVFAVAATLLIFNVQLDKTAPGGLLAALLAAWPKYAAYVAGFLTIGVMWLNHHGLFERISHLDRTLVFLNLLLLMAIVFIPFSTAELGSNILVPRDANTAASLYAINASLIAVLFGAVWMYALSRSRLLSPDVDRLRPLRARVPGIGEKGSNQRDVFAVRILHLSGVPYEHDSLRDHAPPPDVVISGRALVPHAQGHRDDAHLVEAGDGTPDQRNAGEPPRVDRGDGAGGAPLERQRRLRSEQQAAREQDEEQEIADRVYTASVRRAFHSDILRTVELQADRQGLRKRKRSLTRVRIG